MKLSTCVLLFFLSLSTHQFPSAALSNPEIELTSDTRRLNMYPTLYVKPKDVAVLGSILSSKLDTPTTNFSLENAPSFTLRYTKFVIDWDWSKSNNESLASLENTLSKAAKYNLIWQHQKHFQPIEFLITIFPRASISLSADLDTSIQLFNEHANFKFPGTVSTLLLNYRKLRLNSQAVPVVREDIHSCNARVPKNLTCGVVLDAGNCFTLYSSTPAPLVQLQLTKMNRVVVNSDSTRDNPLYQIYVIRQCVRTLANYTNLFGAKTVYRNKASFRAIMEKYDANTTDTFQIFYPPPFISIYAINHPFNPEEDATENSATLPNFGEFLEKPAQFSKASFGVSLNYSQVPAGQLELIFPDLLRRFRIFLIESGDSPLGEGLSHFVEEVATLTRKTDFGQENVFENGIPVRLFLEMSLKSEQLEQNNLLLDNTLVAVKKANKIYPGIAPLVLINWMDCFRGEDCDINWKEIDEADNYFKKHYDALVPLFKYLNSSVPHPTGPPLYGFILDIAFVSRLLVVTKGYQTNVSTTLTATKAGYFLPVLTQAHILYIRYMITLRLINEIGGVSTSHSLIRRFKNDFVFLYFSLKVKQPIGIYVRVIGCHNNYSNASDLQEFILLWEILNNWSVSEQIRVIMATAFESEVVQQGQEINGCNTGPTYSHVNELQCRCGWWSVTAAAQQNNMGSPEVIFQEKKSIAWNLYQKERAVPSSTNEKGADGTKFPDAFILVPVVVSALIFCALVGVVTAYLVLRYKAKNSLSKKQVQSFFLGNLHSRRNANDAAGSVETDDDDRIQRQPYNAELYEIPPSSFKIDTSRCLGSGEFGSVYVGVVKRGPEEIQVAIKMKSNLGRRKETSHGDSLALKGLISEIKILSYVGQHENIVGLIGAYTAKLRSGQVFVFLEFCPRGSLNSHLRSIAPEDSNENSSIESDSMEGAETVPEGRGRLPVELMKNLVRWSWEIAYGMEFLTSKNLVHADLATRNLLLTDSLQVKIADFGLSRRLYNYSEYLKRDEAPLPWRWMAPESLRKLIFNEKTDVWAFGVTLWEIFMLGDLPYPGLSWDVNFPTMLDGGMRMEKPKYGTKQIVSVMDRCWYASPYCRPTFTEIQQQIKLLLVE